MSNDFTLIAENINDNAICQIDLPLTVMTEHAQPRFELTISKTVTLST